MTVVQPMLAARHSTLSKGPDPVAIERCNMSGMLPPRSTFLILAADRLAEHEFTFSAPSYSELMLAAFRCSTRRA